MTSLSGSGVVVKYPDGQSEKVDLSTSKWKFFNKMDVDDEDDEVEFDDEASEDSFAPAKADDDEEEDDWLADSDDEEEDMEVFDEDEESIAESPKKKRRLSKKSSKTSKASKPTPQVRLDKERRIAGAKRRQNHYTDFLHREQPSTRRFAPHLTHHPNPFRNSLCSSQSKVSFSPDYEGPPRSSAASSGSNQFSKYKLTMENPTVTPAKSNPGPAPARASPPPPPAASSQDRIMFVEGELNPKGSHMHNHLKFLWPENLRDAAGVKVRRSEATTVYCYSTITNNLLLVASLITVRRTRLQPSHPKVGREGVGQGNDRQGNGRQEAVVGDQSPVLRHRPPLQDWEVLRDVPHGL